MSKENRCDSCNCNCHCNIKGHSDLYGVCSCEDCKCNKEPVTIELGVTNCELAPHTHREVVNIAVMHALGNIESPRMQIQAMENAQME